MSFRDWLINKMGGLTREEVTAQRAAFRASCATFAERLNGAQRRGLPVTVALSEEKISDERLGGTIYVAGNRVFISNTIIQPTAGEAGIVVAPWVEDILITGNLVLSGAVHV